MPVVVSGVKQLQKAMKNVDPELNKEMRMEIKTAMLPIRNTARGYLPGNGQMLSGWTKNYGSDILNYRPFPKYDQSVAQKGIVYREGQNKKNNSGFRAIFYIANTSAAGAIYETAGRKNPQGQPWGGKKLRGSHAFSNSNNPNAGKQFINSLGGDLVGIEKQRGRALYRAWAEDQGRVYPLVVKAIERVATRFNRETELIAAFKKAA
jgi:hypothetical protein